MTTAQREAAAHKRLFGGRKPKASSQQPTLGIEPDTFKGVSAKAQEWRTYFIVQYLKSPAVIPDYISVKPFDYERFIGYFRFEAWLDQRLNRLVIT